MVHVSIKKIIIEGFGSIIEPLEYRFDSLGINLIEGDNGAGKTTIVNALGWVLYKKLIKKVVSIQPWPHIIQDHIYNQGQKFKGTKVELQCTVNGKRVQIFRCMGYTGTVNGKRGGNSLVIIENGKELMSRRDKKDQEQWIKENFGYSFELFKASIMFGQKVTRLTKEDGPAKKQIFDEAFGTLFIVQAKEKVEKRLIAERQQANQAMNKAYTTGETLKQLVEAKINQDKLVLTWKEDIKEKLRNLRNKVKEGYGNIKQLKKGFIILKGKERPLLEKRDRIKRKIGKYEKYISLEFKTMLKVNELESRLVTITQSIAEIDKKLSYGIRRCPQCKQLLDRAGRKKQKTIYKSEKSQLKEEYDEISNTLLPSNRALHEEMKIRLKEKEALERKFSKVQEKIGKLEKDKNHNSLIKRDILNEVKNIRAYQRDIKSLNKKRNGPTESELLKNLPEKIKELEERFKVEHKEQKQAEKRVEIDEWLLKDPLSNSGLKAHIFDTMLAKVNRHAKAYKNLVGFQLKVYVEMASAHKQINISIFQGENEVPYDDLSGGQQQLVDVTLAFAMNDTVTSIKPINILVLDEVFESLTKDNIEIVGNLILEKAKNRCIHVINHQSSFNPPNAKSTLMKITKHGHTYIAE